MPLREKWTNLVEGHELYTAGHMIEAAVAYYQATGKEKILNIARKNADLICRVFGTGEGQKRGYPGHQEIELALVKLYRVTGERAYLHQAEYFIRERGRNPNYLQAEIEGRGHPEFFPEFERVRFGIFTSSQASCRTGRGSRTCSPGDVHVLRNGRSCRGK